MYNGFSWPDSARAPVFGNGIWRSNIKFWPHGAFVNTATSHVGHVLQNQSN